MKIKDFSIAMDALLNGYCYPECIQRWEEFAIGNVREGNYAYFDKTPAPDAAMEKWLDAIYAGLYAVKMKYGLDIAVQISRMSNEGAPLYPGEMMTVAEVFKNGDGVECVLGMINRDELKAVAPFFFDMPEGAAIVCEGPKIEIAQLGVFSGLVQKQKERGYILTDGTVLLEKERDSFGRYKGCVDLDGTYHQTGRLYAPMMTWDCITVAFQEVKPENYLATAEMSVEGNYNQIDGIINNEAPKPSLLDTLRQCQEEAEKGGNAPPAPSRGPER